MPFSKVVRNETVEKSNLNPMWRQKWRRKVNRAMPPNYGPWCGTNWDWRTSKKKKPNWPLVTWTPWKTFGHAGNWWSAWISSINCTTLPWFMGLKWKKWPTLCPMCSRPVNKWNFFRGTKEIANGYMTVGWIEVCRKPGILKMRCKVCCPGVVLVLLLLALLLC